jgi:hypothetical protein
LENHDGAGRWAIQRLRASSIRDGVATGGDGE